MIKHIAIKEDNKPFRVLNSNLFTEELNRLGKGKYIISVDRYRKNKSNSQLGYYFSCVLPMFMQGAIDAGWEVTSLDECDAWLKSQFANRDLINKHSGEVIQVPALKRQMTTVEFSTFVNQVREWASEFLGVYIPEPGEQTNINFE